MRLSFLVVVGKKMCKNEESQLLEGRRQIGRDTGPLERLISLAFGVAPVAPCVLCDETISRVRCIDRRIYSGLLLILHGKIWRKILNWSCQRHVPADAVILCAAAVFIGWNTPVN